MKFKLHLTFALILINLFMQAQTPNWQWAKGVGGSAGDWAYAICNDQDGNLYVTGTFGSPTVTFGSTTLFNSAARSLFLVKYNSDGVVIWAKSVGGTNANVCSGEDIQTDSQGNLYLTGSFSDTLTFDSITLISALSSSDAFVAKLDSSGNTIWAKNMGGIGSASGKGIDTDQNNNVYVTGEFNDSLSVGSITLTNDDLSTADIFVAKYDSEGNVLWAQSAGGSYIDEVRSLSANPDGDVYITGSFRSPTITFGSTTLVNMNNSDIFIAKYSTDGTLEWAERAGGGGYDYGEDLSADDSNNVYVTGSFAGPYLFYGNDTIAGIGPGFGQLSTTFVLKLDSLGDIIWAKTTGNGSGSNRGKGITHDSDGNVLVTGYFLSSLIVDNTTLNDPAVGGNLFVLAYNSSGILVNAKSARGPGTNNVQSISIDPNGNVYVAGSFGADTLEFDSILVTNSTTSGIYHDIFIAQLSISLILSSPKSLGSDADIRIYPNPTNKYANVDLGTTYDEINLSVINVSGALMFSEHFHNLQNLTIDLSEIKTGIYFMKISNSETTLVLKVIKL